MCSQVPLMFNSCAVLTSIATQEKGTSLITKSTHHALTFSSSMLPFPPHCPELLTRMSACPKLFLTACSSFWMSASGVMSMLTTRTLILLFTLRISVLVASSFAMVLLARTKFDAEVLANSSAIAWIQDHCSAVKMNAEARD